MKKKCMWFWESFILHHYMNYSNLADISLAAVNAKHVLRNIQQRLTSGAFGTTDYGHVSLLQSFRYVLGVPISHRAGKSRPIAPSRGTDIRRPRRRKPTGHTTGKFNKTLFIIPCNAPLQAHHGDIMLKPVAIPSDVVVLGMDNHVVDSGGFGVIVQGVAALFHPDFGFVKHSSTAKNKHYFK